MSRITHSDLDTLAARLERAMIARGVHAEGSDWAVRVFHGSVSQGRHWTLCLAHENGQIALLPGLDSEQIGRTAREAYLTLSALFQGLSMVLAQDVHGYTLRDDAIAADK